MCADSNFSDFEVTARLNIGLILKFHKSNDFTIKKKSTVNSRLREFEALDESIFFT